MNVKSDSYKLARFPKYMYNGAKIAAINYEYWYRTITLEEVSSAPGQGTTSYGNVYSTNPNEYPNGAEKDEFWYVSAGIQ